MIRHTAKREGILERLPVYNHPSTMNNYTMKTHKHNVISLKIQLQLFWYYLLGFFSINFRYELATPSLSSIGFATSGRYDPPFAFRLKPAAAGEAQITGCASINDDSSMN